MKIFTSTLLLSIVILFTTIPQKKCNSQPSSKKFYVTHLNLKTHKEQTFVIDGSTFQKGPNYVDGFNGMIETLLGESLRLKSFDSIATYVNNPPFPESAILYAYNAQTKLDLNAALISPKYVLTAADEIYSARESLNELIFCSQNYLKGLDDDNIAIATDLYFFTTTWNSDDDWKNNLALVKLNRPLGATLGWFGYGYDDNDFYKNNEFFISTIDVDYYTYNVKKYKAIPDHYGDDFLYIKKEQFMHGAPLYLSSGILYGMVCFDGYVNSVPTYNGVTKITQDKYNTIKNITVGDLPDQPDIMPINVKVEPREITVNSTLESLEFYLHNYSSVANNGEIKIEIYLSDNNVVSINDKLIHTYTINTNFPALKSYRFAPSDKPRIPIDVKPGEYFVGIRININDFDTINNCTVSYDCDTLRVLNPFANNFVSGNVNGINTDGYCVLRKYLNNKISNNYEFVEVAQDGTYEFNNIFIGDYSLAFYPKNETINCLRTYYSKTPYWYDANLLKLGISDTLKNINIDVLSLQQLLGTKTISGSLVNNSTKSSIAEADNFFTDVNIILQNTTGDTLKAIAHCDESGFYKIQNIENGSYQLKIDKPGYTMSSFHPIQITNLLDSLTDINFEFLPDSTIEARNITSSPFYLKDNINMVIYPNPASQDINISFKSAPNIYFIELYNNLGQMVLQKQCTGQIEKLDLKNLNSGIYSLNIFNNDFAKTEKIIVR